MEAVIRNNFFSEIDCFFFNQRNCELSLAQVLYFIASSRSKQKPEKNSAKAVCRASKVATEKSPPCDYSNSFYSSNNTDCVLALA